MTNEVWEFVHVCALVADVSERLLFELTSDPRIPQRLTELRSVLDECVIGLHEHPFHFWGILCSQIGSDPLELRHKVLHAASIALTYIEEKTFKHAGMCPWNLLEGDIAHNLDDFMTSDISGEPSIAHSIQRLARSPLYKQSVLSSLELLAQIPWSTMLVEQLHGAASLVRRHHPDYSCDMLQCRSFLYTSSKLLALQSKSEARKERVRARLAHVFHKQPSKISGRHMYLREGVNRARGQFASGSGKFSKASYSRM
eukprot:384517-Amphidinium_carterae.1